jgi:cytochrome P450
MAPSHGTGPRLAEIIEAVTNLFLADYETVAARIAYGTLFLIAHPEQRFAFQEDKSLATATVEETIRIAVPGGSWLPRYALANIEYGNVTIRTGDLVVFSVQSANRDESEFSRPHEFDIHRTPNRHVGFGYGKFHCLGAGLARMILKTFYTALFRRLPDLSLNISPDDLEINKDSVTGGLQALPVTWSRTPTPE